MAKQEHIEKLQHSIKEWNTWRENHPGEKIDLSGAALIGANLRGANLIGANLSEANLDGVDLSEANLSETQLIRTQLNRANLTKAALGEADLSEADLSEADLNIADFIRAKLIRTCLNGADLGGADFSGANLYGADLSEARTYMTHFANIDLRGVKGLENIQHMGPSHISTSTLEKSGGEIPEIFLRGAGVGPNLIDYTQALFGKPVEYYTCFISYSSKDDLFARRLHNDLQQEGVRCWFAPEDMDIGDKIRPRIDESIRLYDKLLLILSEHSIASSWVEYEVEQALDKEPQGIPNVLYPVRVDRAVMSCSTVWANKIKNTRHIGNFEHWTDPKNYEINFTRLLRALNPKKDQEKV